ncbi:MAG: M23 family metallopeptidase [candidate division Zixibacteria bacterium]|nr:M23 family metallopeptidase [candidate division Zixibacteria bacterium]
MWKDKITVMIVPRDGGDLSQFAIPTKLLWAIGLCGICFVLVNMFLLADYFDQRVDQARMAKLTDENQMLSEQFLAMEESIQSLQGDYGTLVAKEEAIRTIFGLPVINPEERMLGVGGPTDPNMKEVTLPTAAAMEVNTDVDELLRLSKFERQRYQEVYELLKGKKDILDHTPSIMPTRGYFSSGYGYRSDPFTGLREFHPGLDISNHRGTPIYATADGKVVSVRTNGGLGKMISIDHGNGMKSRYGHLSAYKVKVGQRIKRGDIIGLMGDTGNVTGPHLHYEIIKNGKHVNPYRYIINRK